MQDDPPLGNRSSAAGTAPTGTCCGPGGLSQAKAPTVISCKSLRAAQGSGTCWAGGTCQDPALFTDFCQPDTSAGTRPPKPHKGQTLATLRRRDAGAVKHSASPKPVPPGSISAAQTHLQPRQGRRAPPASTEDGCRKLSHRRRESNTGRETHPRGIEPPQNKTACE